MSSYLEDTTLAAVVFALVLGVQLYAFRPAYGYLNTRKRVALDGSFRRVPFNRVKLAYEEGTLIIRDISSSRIFFKVPGITESQFDEINSCL